MNIRNTIAAINQMLADGIIEQYAIGGAVGATFYLEPIATLDADIFVTFRSEAGSLLASPQPVFDYLKARGGRMEGECIVSGSQGACSGVMVGLGKVGHERVFFFAAAEGAFHA